MQNYFAFLISFAVLEAKIFCIILNLVIQFLGRKVGSSDED